MYTEENTIEKFPTVGKIIVERSLEEQIRTMCALSPDKEWSGVLFYTAEGSLEDKSIVIRAKNFYLMDLGSAGYTEFKLGDDPSIARFMVDNNLFDCKTGLIHSHNEMSAFFSGTDTSTLEKEGKTMPNFVSLVVNNAGKYVAAVTHKITTIFSGKAVSSYSLFGANEESTEEKDFVKSVESVKIFGLSVEVCETENPLIERFLTLRKTNISTYKPFMYGGSLYNKDKKTEKKSIITSPYSIYYDDDYGSDTLFPDYYKSYTNAIETKDKERDKTQAEIPDDFTELIGYCIQELLAANSKFNKREALNIMKNSDYPIISIVNTYKLKATDKKFTENIKDTIANLRFKCMTEHTTWSYIKDFVVEELTDLSEDERELATNKSWYKKVMTIIKKITSIIDNDN